MVSPPRIFLGELQSHLNFTSSHESSHMLDSDREEEQPEIYEEGEESEQEDDSNI
jgi:hypothetical protein